MNHRIITLSFLLMVFSLSAQLKKKVLFIGNSYTYYNNLPQLVKDIALSKTDTLIFDQSVVGGYTFQNHHNDASTQAKIKSNNWDAVIIQGQSQEPSFSPTQVMNNSYPFAGKLADSVRAANPCAEVMYYMTWGRKNGDASNCGVYPPVCTYAGMQARLRQSYLLFADSFNASCAPVGVAWKTYRNAYPSIDLYDLDESHPSPAGSYLAACVIYSSVFKKNAIGATYYSALSQTVAQSMQTIGGNTVMDSTWIWNLNSQIPTANFNYSPLGGTTFQFNNTSVNATNYTWSFGSTLHSPQNTFAGSPPYTVTLTAANGCTTSSVVKTISATNIQNNKGCNSKVFFNSESNYLSLQHCDDYQSGKIIVCDLSGKLVKEFYSTSQNETINLSFLEKGMYLVNLRSETQNTVVRIVKN